MTAPENRQLVMDVAMRDTRLSEDAFFEGPCNAAALSEIRNAASWDGLPRVLSGPPHSGKTHLAHIFAERTGAAMLWAGALAPAQVAAVRTGAALVLEDGHLLAGDAEAEATAFHLYNQARDRRQAFLITGRGPLGGWGLGLPDLASRLTASAPLTVASPDQTTLRMVLIKGFADRQLAVAADVVEYALTRMERSFTAAAGLVAALDDANLSQGRPITKPMIRAILAASDPAEDTGEDP